MKSLYIAALAFAVTAVAPTYTMNGFLKKAAPIVKSGAKGVKRFAIAAIVLGGYDYWTDSIRKKRIEQYPMEIRAQEWIQHKKDTENDYIETTVGQILDQEKKELNEKPFWNRPIDGAHKIAGLILRVPWFILEGHRIPLDIAFGGLKTTEARLPAGLCGDHVHTLQNEDATHLWSSFE